MKTRGNVVTISSVNGLAAFGNIEYSAAKAGQIAMTVNYAARYGELGVRFNVVAPGTIRTPNWDNQPGTLERFSKMYPLGRVGEPEDIAAAVAFLASDDASWITGHTLPVEGGVLTGPRGEMDLTPSGAFKKEYPGALNSCSACGQGGGVAGGAVQAAQGVGLLEFVAEGTPVRGRRAKPVAAASVSPRCSASSAWAVVAEYSRIGSTGSTKSVSTAPASA